MHRAITILCIPILLSTIHPKPAKGQGNKPPILKKDSLAIVALYNATGGPTWSFTDTWCPGTRCWLQPGTWARSWYGLEFVSDTSPRVGKIKLVSNNLAGIIPDEIGDLDALTHLNLSDNALVKIPETIANLTSLTKLWVAGNLLFDFPEVIYSMSSLEDVSLGGNLLSGSLPLEFTTMPNLKYLYLGGNDFDGGIPPEYGSFPALEVLGLSGCNLTGAIPKELLSLKTLRWLHLYNNKLSGKIPSEIEGLESLQHLDLGFNALHGEIPATMGNLDNLGFLRLYDNALSGEIPASLGNLKKLERIDLSYNVLSGSIPATFGGLENLVILNLSANQLSGEIPGELGALKNLYELTFAQNELSGKFPPEIGDMERLELLRLSRNQLEGFLPDLSSSNLIVIDVSHNRLKNESRQSPFELSTYWSLENLPPNIQALDLSHNSIDGNLAFIQSRPFQSLRLNNNHLQGLAESSTPPTTFLDISNNVLDFYAIENALSWSPPPNNLFYSPQDSIPGLPRYVVGRKGDTIRLTPPYPESESSDVNFQWIENGIVLPGAQSRNFDIGPLTPSHAGNIYRVEASKESVEGLTLTTTATHLAYSESRIRQSNWAVALEVDQKEFNCVFALYGGRAVRLEPGHVMLPDDVVIALCGGAKFAIGELGTVEVNGESGLSVVEIRELLRIDNSIEAASYLLGYGNLSISDPGAGVSKSETSSRRHTISTPNACVSTNGGFLSVAHDSSSAVSTVTVTNGSASVVFDTLAVGSKMNAMAAADSIAISAWQTVMVTNTGLQPVEDFAITSFEISSDTTYLKTEDDWTFSAFGGNGAGLSSPIRVNWTAAGGTIDADGYFVAGDIPGTYTVAASEPVSGLEASAVIVIEDRTSVATEEAPPVTMFRLMGNYPNPFSNSTMIPFSVAEAGNARLTVYDITGRQVAELLNRTVQSGEHQVTWDGTTPSGSRLASGVYFIVLDTDSGQKTSKVLLVR